MPCPARPRKDRCVKSFRETGEAFGAVSGREQGEAVPDAEEEDHAFTRIYPPLVCYRFR